MAQQRHKGNRRATSGREAASAGVSGAALPGRGRASEPNTSATESGADLLDTASRKLLLRLVLPIAVVSFMNSIDRVNISYAGHALMGDLGITPEAFGMVVSCFFVAYLIFQYPHAALLKRMGIRRWLSATMLGWGLAGAWMSAANGIWSLFGARALLGMCEAGFAAGMTYYITRFVPRRCRATAMALALSSVPISMVLGGPLCGWMLGLGNPLGIAQWRWMFLLQAIPNVILAGTLVFALVDNPIEARWLDDGERNALRAELALEFDGPTSSAGKLIFGEPGVWLCALTNLLMMTGSYALAYWLPQIVRQLSVGRSEFLIGTLSALPQFGLACGLYLNARLSDRTGERFLHTGIPLLCAGLTMFAASSMPTAQSILLCLVAAGAALGAAQGVFWTTPGALEIGRGGVPVSVIVLLSVFGTLGGIVGPLATGFLRQQSGGFSSAIGFLALLLLLAGAMISLARYRRTATRSK